jgi:hypothetical protein
MDVLGPVNRSLPLVDLQGRQPAID